MKTERDYQMEALVATFGAPGKTALVEMASGLGKTYFYARLAHLYWEACGKRILFLVQMNEALEKAVVEFAEEFEVELEAEQVTFGWMGDGNVVETEAAIVFANFHTIINHLDLFYEDDFGLILVDECHHAHAPTFRYTLGQFTDYDQLVGGTATLRRADGQDIEDIFGEPVYRYGLAKALADGKWLAEVEYRVLTDNLSIRELRKLLKRAKQGDRRITRRQIDRTIFLPERLNAVHRKVIAEQKKGNKKTVIFCRSIDHLERVQKKFKKAIPFHSKLKKSEQKENLAAFEAGEARIILVVDKLNEAIDIPDVDLLVFLRGTESERIWKQQLGRGLRLKELVVIMDFVANCDRMFMIRDLASEGHALLEDEVIEFDTRFSLKFFEDALTLSELLDRLKRDWYSTWEEASAAARKLEVKKHAEYREVYKKDPRLPGHPDDVYSDVWKKNGGWPGFLRGEVPAALYRTYMEASRAVSKLKIRTSTEYTQLQRYKEDPRLPSSPSEVYSDVWKKNGGWPGFLLGEKKVKRSRGDFYSTWAQASRAARKLKIRTGSDYKGRYKEDPRLPSSPNEVYSDVWKKNGGWPGFLRGENPKSFYSTWKKGAAAARKLKIRTGSDYKGRYKEDPRLPSSPNEVYSDVWKKNGGWPGFLLGEKKVKRSRGDFYSTWAQASRAARKCGFNKRSEYLDLYRIDSRLPSDPMRVYSDVWNKNGGWPGFLLGEKKVKRSRGDFYSTWAQASRAARKLGIKTQPEYRIRYKEDPRLPSDPAKIYSDVWTKKDSWFEFLGTRKRGDYYSTWNQASKAARRLGFKKSGDYGKGYKKDPRLPSSPNVKYAKLWKKRGGWPGFLGTKK